MARPGADRTLAAMVAVQEWVADAAPAVYGAALAVAEDRAAAVDVTAHVLARSVASLDGRDQPDELADAAVSLAVRAAPCAELAPMRAEDREVVALARLRGRSVAEIARALELDERTVRAQMTRGLREAARSRACAPVLQLAGY